MIDYTGISDSYQYFLGLPVTGAIILIFCLLLLVLSYTATEFVDKNKNTKYNKGIRFKILSELYFIFDKLPLVALIVLVAFLSSLGEVAKYDKDECINKLNELGFVTDVDRKNLSNNINTIRIEKESILEEYKVAYSERKDDLNLVYENIILNKFYNNQVFNEIADDPVYGLGRFESRLKE
jgi:hypothetical protein